MDFVLALARELVEEERNTCEEHHNAVENRVEEQHPNFCFERLHCAVLDTLNIAANRIVAVENERRKRACNCSAYHCENADNKRKRGIEAFACFKFNILKHIGLEH